MIGHGSTTLTPVSAHGARTYAQQGRYAQFVIGPAGSGKSTYCFGAQDFIAATQTRLPALVVNLDPGQERSEEEEARRPFDLDIRDLISVSYVFGSLHT